jgi:hypothetical protein
MNWTKDFLDMFSPWDNPPTLGQKILLGILFLVHVVAIIVCSPFMLLGWIGWKALERISR